MIDGGRLYLLSAPVRLAKRGRHHLQRRWRAIAAHSGFLKRLQAMKFS